MARLTAKQRSNLPAKDFAGPGRSFPLNDRPHELAAIIDVGKAVKAGHLSAEEGAHIRGEARSKLRKSPY